MKLPRLCFLSMPLMFPLLIGVGVHSSVAQNQPTNDYTLHPGSQTISHHKIRKSGLFGNGYSRRRARLYRRPNPRHTAEYEFYERVERIAREKKKLVKKLARAQYSNFMYFGHRHKPKKRPPYKMKYCDVCGIRH